MPKKIVFLGFSLLFSCLPAQDSEYKSLGWKIIFDLSKKEYYGRGYVKEGHLKAASYISLFFEKNNIPPLNGNYFQPFTIEVVSFPRTPLLKINNRKLKAGHDFMLNGWQKEWKSTYRKKELSDNLLQVDTIKRNSNPTLVKVSKLPPVAYSRVLKDDSTIYVVDKKLPDKIKKIKIDIQPLAHSELKTQNVMAFLEGQKDSIIIICAHYDHLGAYGEAGYFPGSHDNASGVALMLCMAKKWATHTEKPPYHILFVAFGAEEVGLLGSNYFVSNPLVDLKKIKQVVNLDLMGGGKDGIVIENAESNTKLFNQIQKWNEEKKGFSQIKPRKNKANSDHFPFSQKEIPAFFFYTLGEAKEYHNVHDNPQNVTLSKWDELVELLTFIIHQ